MHNTCTSAARTDIVENRNRVLRSTVAFVGLLVAVFDDSFEWWDV
jgi:hypothetical protein